MNGNHNNMIHSCSSDLLGVYHMAGVMLSTRSTVSDASPPPLRRDNLVVIGVGSQSVSRRPSQHSFRCPPEPWRQHAVPGDTLNLRWILTGFEKLHSYWATVLLYSGYVPVQRELTWTVMPLLRRMASSPPGSRVRLVEGREQIEDLLPTLLWFCHSPAAWSEPVFPYLGLLFTVASDTDHVIPIFQQRNWALEA